MSTTYPDLSFTSFPDSEQSFVEMTDLNSSDGALMTQYQQAMMAGDFSTARNILNQIPNSNNKILDSVKMNTLFDTTVALERFYNSDIKDYISNKQEEWEGIVNLFTANFTYKGNYQSGNTYQQNNIVSAINAETGDTFLYIAIQNNNAPISDVNSWRPLTIKGSQGASGDGLVFMGVWNQTQPYNINDVVVNNDTLWVALQPNTNKNPSSTSGYWQNYGNFTITNIVVSSSEPSLEVGNFWFEVIS